MKAKRIKWQEAKLSQQKERLVFLDESSVNIDMTRRYGRAVGKERVHGSVPLNTPKSQTIRIYIIFYAYRFNSADHKMLVNSHL